MGCAGSFDDRAKRYRCLRKILTATTTKFAILGNEETQIGRSQRRAAMSFCFKMQAMNNIQIEMVMVLRNCNGLPALFQYIKNEYPELGGNYEVIHHSAFIQQLYQWGQDQTERRRWVQRKKITYHDSCYLGRYNNIYEAPRAVLQTLDADLIEMKALPALVLCCGAGGAQMFKEPEKGNKDINIARAEEAIETKQNGCWLACFGMTMLTDGIKTRKKRPK